MKKIVFIFFFLISTIFPTAKLKTYTPSNSPNERYNMIFRSIVGRGISAEELNLYLNNPLGEMFAIDNLFSSAEYNQKSEKFIREVYKFLLEREVDEVGLNFWKTRAPLELFYGIVLSDEYKTNHPNEVFSGSNLIEISFPVPANPFSCILPENKIFLPSDYSANKIFRSILGREITENEYLSFCKTSQNIQTDLIKYLLDSESYKIRIESFVSKMYEYLLGRAPEQEGLNFWSTRFPLEMFYGITLSSEYKLKSQFGNKTLVSEVIDGETFKTTTGLTVKLSGVNAPDFGTKNQCFAENSKTGLQTVLNLVTNTTSRDIYLESDVQDELNGQKLKYVYTEYQNLVGFINEWMIRFGYARTENVPNGTKYLQKLLDAENLAKQEKLGLWKACYLSSGMSVDDLICNADTYNCTDFKAQKESQEIFNYCYKVSGKDIHGLDKDGNLKSCESLK